MPEAECLPVITACGLEEHNKTGTQKKEEYVNGRVRKEKPRY